MSEESGNVFNLGSIDFTPDWARKSAGVNVGKIRPEREETGGEERGGGKTFGERKNFGERKPFAGGKPFPGRPTGNRPARRASGEGARPRFVERPKPLDVEVKILPETKALGTIIRKLQGDTHAYKLKDLAYFFLDNPQSVLLKISPRASQSSQPLQPAQTFFQCKACGFASTREEDVLEHAVSAHLGDYYDSKEVEVEPPKGNFNCVAKCGLSGVLLGPPNIHEFNAVVKEMIRTRYPDMSEEQYRAHIEMVRDAETIETWRKGATKRTLFFAKGTADQEGARGLSREQAEGEFKRTILPSMLDTPKHLMITADMAMKSPVKPLQWAVGDALEAERRSPYNMCFALRGAFHHRKLHFFRTNDARGQEFVTNIEYKEFDVAHAIPELASVAKFVAEHPCCDKSEFPPEADFEKHLNWLVTTGHVVSFTNGVFSPVEKFPKYGPQWKKRQKPEPEPTVAEAEPTVAESAPTVVAESAPTVAAEPAPTVAAEPEPTVAETEPKAADGGAPQPAVVEAPVSVEDNVADQEKKDEVAPVVAE